MLCNKYLLNLLQNKTVQIMENIKSKFKNDSNSRHYPLRLFYFDA